MMRDKEVNIVENVKEIKSVLAKLLATENLTVEFSNVETASFDVEKRILRIPTLKDIDAEILDLFVGHEVSHALYTPMSGMDKLRDKPKNFHSFVNVVEDVRIERLIQKKYPGLKKPFYNAYSKLQSNNFFHTDGKKTEEMLLIDRLNLKAKLGTQIDIPFTDVEQDFLTRSQKTETFDEVFTLAEELYEYCQEELENKTQNGEDTEQYMSVESDNSNEEQGEQETSQSDENQEETGSEVDQPSNSGEEQDENSDEEKGTGQGGQKTNEEGNDSEETERKSNPAPKKNMTGKIKSEEGLTPGAKSITDLGTQQSTRELVETDTSKQVRYLDIPKVLNVKDYTVPFAEIKKSLYDHWSVNTDGSREDTLAKNVKEFKKKNEKIINYLHKEFEMKKQADRYARATSARTGVLNVNKLHSYKYNDDIFLKKNIIPNGKDHGMIFFLDWSGSMADNMHGTMQQLINLALFCRKANIPFAAYGFSSEWAKRISPEQKEKRQSHNLHEALLESVSLLELFHEKMTSKEFNDALGISIAIGSMYDRKSRGDYAWWGLPRNMYLGGTPLNHTICIATRLIKEFKQRNNVQIVSTSFLTDGSSHGIDGVSGYREGRAGEMEWTKEDSSYKSAGTLILRDGQNQVAITNTNIVRGYTYSISTDDITKGLYKLMKISTGANTTGFFIAGRQEVRYAWQQYFQKRYSSELGLSPSEINGIHYNFDEWKKQMTRENCSVSYASGLDELYIIKGGKNLEVEDEGLGEDLNGASKQKLTSAFKRMGKGKLQNRVVLQKFIDMVA